MRRAAVLAATVALLVASLAGPASAQEPSKFTVQPLDDSGVTIQAFKSASAQIAQSDPELLARTDSDPITVMVKLDVDGAATYAGGLAGLAATSPAATGKKLKDNKAAVGKYRAYVSSVNDTAAAQIQSMVPGARVMASYDVAYGGVLVRLPAASAKSLLAIPGVAAVQQDTLAQPLTDTTPTFIGATEAWKSLGGSKTAGQGVIVGVIDTGIWPEHPSFADPGIPSPGGGPYACEFGDGTDPALGPAFTCNDKLVGAYAFTDTYMAVTGAGADEYCDTGTGECSARDADGHGTHTASTSAGSGVSSAVLLGTERGPISGIAPGASVIAYRVCLADGCYGSDSVAAVQQAILNGVDVINFSISGGANPYTDPVELAFLDAYNAGISVNASAGNYGPDAATADHGGPWVTTVGASTSNRAFLTTATISDGAASITLTGTSVAAGTGTAKPVVIPTGDELCKGPFAADTFTGKIVVCKRGDTGRAEKGYRVLQGGAAGMILYNQSTAVTDLETDNHYLPAVQVQYTDGQALLAFLDAHPDATASWATGTKTTVPGDVMASFSSRGPLGNDFLKPDVTAPGVSILAGHSPQHMPPDAGGVALGPQGELFQAIAGTSMSSPHAAGVSALVKAAHPDWTPDMIKSALMTSSVQTVLKEDGATPATPYDRGAGSIRADRAINPTFVLRIPAGAYEESAGDALGRINLNLPSIQQRDFTGVLTTTRTITNVSGVAQPFKVRVDAPAGYAISVSPAQGALPAGTSLALAITIDGRNAAIGLAFGQITIEPNKKGSTAAVLPIAIDKVDSSSIGFSHSCDVTTIDRGASAHCTVTAQNLVASPATATIRVAGPTNGKLAIQNPAGATGIVPSGNGFTWTGALSPALAPQVLSIENANGDSPAGGYLPLSAFGIAPIGGVGDETISNFDVPAFNYGGETYTTIGLVSDGYAVIGGGTSADINFEPQTFPNAARPNNVVAPLWTDLNPAQGGAMRIGILAGGGLRWLVADWEDVVVWGTTEKQSFQVWIQLGDTEGIWMTYGTLTTPSAPVNAGAENRDGTSGQNIAPVADSDWTVSLSGPVPGGAVTLTYDAFGRNTGTFTSTASLTSDIAAGTNVRAVSITVK